MRISDWSSDVCSSDAVVTRDGKRHVVDTLIYGNGFHATDFLAPMKVRGLDGLDLNDAWRDGAEAYKGICVSGFPNLFMLYGPDRKFVVLGKSVSVRVELGGSRINYKKL